MNSIWVHQLKNVLCSIKDSEVAIAAIEACSAKIADWASCLIGFYSTSAIAMALVSVQVQTQLPLGFHFLYFSILLGFSFLLFAEFVMFKSVVPNQILRCLSLFSLVLAFFIAISIPFPLYLKIVSLITFLAALSFIVYFTVISTA